jgi:uncharacterized protein (TIGR02246 family)
VKNPLLTIPLVLLVCFTLSCQKGEEVAEEVKARTKELKEDAAKTAVRQSIAEANIKLSETVRAGDASALANLYTEDARLISPESEIFRGRESVEAYWAGGLQSGLKDVALTTVDVMGMDDMVCEVGRADLTIQPEGKDEIKAKGKYLVLWKKSDDGTWKIYLDIMF